MRGRRIMAVKTGVPETVKYSADILKNSSGSFQRYVVGAATETQRSSLTMRADCGRIATQGFVCSLSVST